MTFFEVSRVSISILTLAHFFSPVQSTIVLNAHRSSQYLLIHAYANQFHRFADHLLWFKSAHECFIWMSEMVHNHETSLCDVIYSNSHCATRNYIQSFFLCKIVCLQNYLPDWLAWRIFGAVIREYAEHGWHTILMFIWQKHPKSR